MEPRRFPSQGLLRTPQSSSSSRRLLRRSDVASLTRRPVALPALPEGVRGPPHPHPPAPGLRGVDVVGTLTTFHVTGTPRKTEARAPAASPGSYDQRRPYYWRAEDGGGAVRRAWVVWAGIGQSW